VVHPAGSKLTGIDAKCNIALLLLEPSSGILMVA